MDNVLSKLADPVMIGTAIETNSSLVSKYIKKIDPLENVWIYIYNYNFYHLINW